MSTRLSQTTSFTFPLEQAQDVTVSNGSLDVTDDRTSSSAAATFSIHEFDANLRHIASVSCSSEDSVDLGKLDRLILFGKVETRFSKAVKSQYRITYKLRRAKLAFLSIDKGPSWRTLGACYNTNKRTDTNFRKQQGVSLRHVPLCSLQSCVNAIKVW